MFAIVLRRLLFRHTYIHIRTNTHTHTHTHKHTIKAMAMVDRKDASVADIGKLYSLVYCY